MKRHLSLRSEHLAELTPGELGVVGGAGPDVSLTQLFTGYYPSINAPCTTLIENLTTGTN